MSLVPDASEAVQKPLHEYPPAVGGSRVFAHYGIDATRYNSVSWISGEVVLMAAGKFVLFVNIRTGLIESQDGPADGGVGVVAVHPSHKFYVVGERAPVDPLIRVYAWPTRASVAVFSGGATVGFSACCFDAQGTRMATVGTQPDYTLAVWDWSTKSMILRSKCFGADVLTVRFSSFDSSLLVTSGASHIKFWTTAMTFTGLKLQGTLAKFGRLDISTITGFVVLPDGKVVSGSEGGFILLWECDLVRCSFARNVLTDDRWDGEASVEIHRHDPCHTGAITVVELIHQGRIVVTGGDDGYLRYWSREELETAEGEGLPPVHVPKCLFEMNVTSSYPIRSMTQCGDLGVWVVIDSRGTLHTPCIPTAEVIRAGRMPDDTSSLPPPLHFNGGGITCSILSPFEHVAITGGEDGVIRLIDYVRGVELRHMRFPSFTSGHAASPSAVTSLALLQGEKPPLTILAGFGNGMLCLVRLESGFRLLGQWRAHADGLFAVAVDPDVRQLCSVSRDGTVFFFGVSDDLDSLEPLGFCKSPLPDPLCIEWDIAVPGGCLVGYETGQVLSLRAPRRDEVDHEVSYEFPCSYSLVGIRQKKLSPAESGGERKAESEEDLLEVKDEGPWAVILIRRLPDRTLAIGMRSEELLYVYHTTIRYPGLLSLPPLPLTGIEPPNYVEEPHMNLCYRGITPLSVFIDHAQKYLLVVGNHATIILREFCNLESVTLLGQAHDSTNANITSALISYDSSMVVSSGMDGLVVAQLRDGFTAPRTEFDAVATTVRSPIEEIVRADPQLPIQEQKEADDRLREEQQCQERKKRFMEKLSIIHDAYAAVLRDNRALPEAARLTEAELELDPALRGLLEAEKQRCVQEVWRDYALQAARENTRTHKLRRRFIDNLLYDRFLVHSFDKRFAVSSFRTVNPADAIARIEQQILDLEESDPEMDAEDDNGNADVAHPASSVCGEHNARSENGLASPLPFTTAEDERQSASRMGASVQQQLNKLDERRRERESRRAGYAELVLHKPDPAEDDAELAERLKLCRLQRGECVLRTDPAYRSTHACRPKASAKLSQMIALEKYMVNRRAVFNDELLHLREEKRGIIAAVNDLRRRMADISNHLRDASFDTCPLFLQSDEEPEKRFDASEEDLDRFAKRKAEERAHEELVKKAQRGFGADLAGTSAVPGDNITSAVAGAQEEKRGTGASSIRHSRNHASVIKTDRASLQTVRHGSATLNRAHQEMRAKLDNIKFSQLEEEEQSMRRVQLHSELQRLRAQSNVLVEAFDKKLGAVLRHRADVDADLCLADLHLLRLFREYQLLLVYRKRDKELREQMHSIKRRREVLRQQTKDQRDEIDRRRSRLSILQEQLKTNKLVAEQYILDSFPTERVPYIMKVFHRHIKRSRQHDDDDDDDDVTSDDDEEEIEDDIGEEVCPANCDIAAWEAMLEYRRRRLDLSGEQADEKVQLEQLAKELGAAEDGIASCIREIKECHMGMEDLESAKHKDLNLLNVVVSLRCDQVRCLNDASTCPVDLKSADVVVVSDEELDRLRRRIDELAKEKYESREEIRGMAEELQQLQAAKAATQKTHAEWEEKVFELMMLKFGQRVDLEMLESCGTSRRIEARKEELRQAELSVEREVRKHENRILGLRDHLQKQIIPNTHLLQDYGNLESDRQRLERSLEKTATKTVQRYRDARVATLKERTNLRLLISAQQEEIDALNAEIMMLRRSGGHVYSPASYQ